ncbi:hypothetical protein JOQ06_024451 [Pogonophryne albipinna]|uniref:Uncharacterized protein n=1 Tax=Pogonophryne albipinna TaxID=1090488 RepID=A0AAD6F4Y4_9TELE|nr:hypothetical protein JOQ06_024451 [Pogonophryne albipinna]
MVTLHYKSHERQRSDDAPEMRQCVPQSRATGCCRCSRSGQTFAVRFCGCNAGAQPGSRVRASWLRSSGPGRGYSTRDSEAGLSRKSPRDAWWRQGNPTVSQRLKNWAENPRRR